MLLPNEMWRNRRFAVMCLVIFLTWGATNGLELQLTYFWRDVMGFQPKFYALLFLPSPLMGLIINGIMGLVVHRVHALVITTIGLTLCLCAPLAMALATRDSPYWTSCEYLPVITASPWLTVSVTKPSSLLHSILLAPTVYSP